MAHRALRNVPEAKKGEILVPQAIIPIITAVAGAFSVGEGIYSLTKGSGGSGSSSSSTQAAATAAADQQALKDKQTSADATKQLAFQAAPDAQSQTGGALTDAGFSAMVSNLINQPGSADAIKNALFGDSSSGSSPNPSGPNFGLSDIPNVLSSPVSLQDTPELVA